MKTASADCGKEKLTKGQDFPAMREAVPQSPKQTCLPTSLDVSAGSYLSFDLIDFIIRKWSSAKRMPLIYFSRLYSENYHSRFHMVEVIKIAARLQDLYRIIFSLCTLRSSLPETKQQLHTVLFSVLTCFPVIPSTATHCCSPTFSNLVTSFGVVQQLHIARCQRITLSRGNHQSYPLLPPAYKGTDNSLSM